ncbi:MAG: 1-acyl-sn-glycerol-3-phosphate acyltransferase [Clostridia bacterium]|nr:1-acyl-sn-glycerol-3-phosphate acyltransferase [Clostridia bacterium]
MKKGNDKSYRFYTSIATFLFKVLYKPQVIGKENIPEDESLIFAGNHKHAFDPLMVIMSTKRIVHYMAKNELFKGPVGLIFDKIGLIRIYPNKSNQIAVIDAEKVLNNGGTIGIFPEGTRNRTEKELLNFKRGTVRMAKATNTKILPFAIRGDYKLFRKSVVIEFGNVIDVSQMEIEEANSYLKEEVLKLLRK